MFDELGVETYTQENERIFPTSNSAKDVREKILNNLKNVQIQKEEVKDIINIYQKINLFESK